MILLHYTGMETSDAALALLRSASSKVSSHYFVDERRRHRSAGAGRTPRLACRAYRPGSATPTSIRARSASRSSIPATISAIRDFPDVQIEAVIALCRDIVERRNIPLARVLAHSDVAPARKNDPGEKFPWDELADAGIGLWVEPTQIVPGPELDPGDQAARSRRSSRSCRTSATDLSRRGVYDETTTQVVTAFQRHYRPARVDGIADHSTLETLKRLLAARDALVPPTVCALDLFASQPIHTGSVGRTAARGNAERRRGGKSGLHGHTVPDNVRRGRPQGKCHREADRPISRSGDGKGEKVR